MALRELFATFGIDFETEKLEKGERSIDKTIGRVKALGAAVAGSAVLIGIKQLASNWATSGTQIENQAKRLGVTTDAIQELEFVAGGAGKGMDEIVDAMSTLQERARDAFRDGATSDAAEQFQRLGLTVTDSNGELKDAVTLFEEYADASAKLTTQTDRVGAAMTMFGDVGRELLPVMENGSEGIRAMRKEAQELGGGLSKTAIAMSKDLDVAMRRSMFGLKAVGSQLRTALIPHFIKAAAWVTKAGKTFVHLMKNTNMLEIAFKSLGAVLVGFAIRFAIANAMPLAFIAMAVALVAAIDDIVNAFRGGPSVIKEFVDALFGIGAGQKFIDQLKFEFEQVAKFGRAIVGIVERIVQLFDSDFSFSFSKGFKQLEQQRKWAERSAAGGNIAEEGETFRKIGPKEDRKRLQRTLREANRTNRGRSPNRFAIVEDEIRLFRAGSKAFINAQKNAAAAQNTINNSVTVNVSEVRDTKIKGEVAKVVDKAQAKQAKETLEALKRNAK